MNFELLSKTHLLHLLSYSIIYTVLYFYIISRDSSTTRNSIIKNFTLGVILIKVSDLFIRYTFVGESWSELIPLHFCNITLIFAIVGILLKSYPLLSIVFFWSVGAAVAVIFPEVREPFPRLSNISFFVTHFYIIFIAFIQCFIYKVKPTFQAWLSSFLIINFIAFVTFFINLVLGTNYMYINSKPLFNSPLDYFGPWPYYIIASELIYIILSLTMLFIFKDRSNNHKMR